MQELGRREDLPESCRAAITAQNLVPLWPSLRAVLPPGKPSWRTHPVHWSYADMRPPLMQAGEMTPIEKAERRRIATRRTRCAISSRARAPAPRSMAKSARCAAAT